MHFAQSQDNELAHGSTSWVSPVMNKEGPMFSEPKLVEGGPNGKQAVTLKEVQCAVSFYYLFDGFSGGIYPGI